MRDNGAIEIEVAKDWLDYVAAFGAVAAIFIAAVAIFLAARSAISAARSAEAAQWTAEAALSEAEQVKRLVGRLIERGPAAPGGSENGGALQSKQAAPVTQPKLGATLSIALELHSRSVIARATVENSGDGPVENVLVSFLAPHTVPFREFGREGRVGEERILGSEAPGVELTTADGSAVQALRHSWRVESLAPGEREHWFAQLFLDCAGDFHLELRAGHKVAAPVRQRYALAIADEGGATIEPIAV